MDHLHLGLNRDPQGRRRHASQRRGVRRRRVADVLAAQPHRPRRPGAGRAVGGVRCVVRRDVAGVAARRLPRARAPIAGPQRNGPGPVAGVARRLRRVHGAHAGVAVAPRGAGGRAAADLRRRGVPAGAGRAARGRRPRGLEHLRAHRSHRGGVRRQARRCQPGQHRPPVAGLGPGGRGQVRRARRLRPGRRSGDRRSRAGPLPGSGQGRREVRADAHAGLEPRLPQRRPGSPRARRPVLLRPRRRPGQGRRAPHRAGRGGLRAGAPARRHRRCGGRAAHRERHAAAGRLHRQRRPCVRPLGRPRPPGRDPARRPRAASGPRRRAAHPHVGQGGPRRAAVAIPRRFGRRRGARPGRHDRLARRAVAGRARHRRQRTRRRLLRARRRVPGRGTARGGGAAALPSGDGGRAVRPPPARIPGRLPRRTEAAAAGRAAQGAPHLRPHANRAGVAVGAAGDAGRAGLGDLAGDRQQRRHHAAPGALDRRGELVVDRGRVRRFRHTARPDEHRGARRAAAAGRPRARHVPTRRAGAPAGVAGRAAGRGQRRGEHGRGAVDGLLRPRAGREGGQGRRPAHHPAGDRHAHPRPPQFGGTRGGPVRHWIDGDRFHVGTITIGNDATVGARTTLLPGAVVGKNADVAPGSAVLGKVKNGQYWKGSPAVKSGKARHPWPQQRPPRAPQWMFVYGVTAMLLGGLPLLALGAGLGVIGWGIRDTSRLREALVQAALWTPAAALAALATYALLTVLGVRLLSIGLREGYHPVRSRAGWQLWATERLMDAARNYLFPLYASLLTPAWLRLLGAKVGRGTEISTVLLTPKFTVVEDGAFLADDTMVASYELGGGWIHAAKATIGKRAFLGNSGITQPGRRVPDDGLVAVLSAAPPKAKAGSSWLGSPPVRLRRQATETDTARTFHPAPRLKVMRAIVETCRLVPVMVTFGIGVAVLFALQYLTSHFGIFWAAAGGGVVVLAAGAAAGAAAVLAKWIVVGRIRVGEHPLWSPFVWRNEVSDTFVETVAAPWFARAASGTPVMNLWLRALGAKIGRGVWCETYWLPEADLVILGKGSTVNRGCVVQTHLFHDRIMRMDTVVLEPGATLGPHCVALPAARLGAGSTVGPASLVMRGDEVPPSTRWQGNPIAPWTVRRKKGGGDTTPAGPALEDAAA